MARSFVRLPKRTVWSLSEAREAVERLIGIATDWCALDEYLITYMTEPSHLLYRLRKNVPHFVEAA